MPEAQGQIGNVSRKELSSGVFYSFVIDDVWYRTGKTNTGVSKGDIVKFEYEVKTFNNRDSNNVVLASLKTKKGAPPQTHQGGKSAQYAPKTLDSDPRQALIMFQNATGCATTAISAAITSGSIKLPTKKAEQYPFLMDLVFKARDEIYNGYVAKMKAMEAGAGAEQTVEEQDIGGHIDDEDTPKDPESVKAGDDWDESEGGDDDWE